MKHLSEEEIVEHYFSGTGSKTSRIAERHLDGCAECAAKRARVADDMNAMKGMDFKELPVDYGERVWSKVSAALPERALAMAPVRRVAWRFGWSWVLGSAAACTALALGAFEIGRIWEQRQHPAATVAKAPAQSPTEPRVVVVVLGDHLDRTERLLVELKHANGEDTDVVKPMREEARSLLVANHVFLEDADKSGDAALTKALDHLGHLLNDVANAPGGLDAGSIARLQREMQADGLLFKVRVLRSRTPHAALTARIAAKGGAA